MSAVLTRRRSGRGSTRGRERDAGRQPSLFSQVGAPPPLEDERFADTAVAPAAVAGHAAFAGPSLDVAMSGLWNALLASEPGACPVCGDAMEPRHSAGAGVVGGRCGCGTTLA